MGMAWCKVSSLTAAVSRTLRAESFPMSRQRVLSLAAGKNVEGWDIDYFLEKALRKKTYADLRTVMRDLDDWLEAQG